MSLYEKSVLAILGCDAVLAAIAIPLAMRKIRRNFFYGFRTPATLSDDRIWYEANAHFGRGLLIACVVGAVAILALWQAGLSPRAFLNASIAALVLPGFIATVATLRFVGALKRGEFPAQPVIETPPESLRGLVRTRRSSMKSPRAGWVAACCVVLAAAAVFLRGSLTAQQPTVPNVKRTVLLRQEMAIPGKEGIMARVEIPPGGAEGRHTHPAEVFGFVERGTVDLFVEGKGTTTYKTGDAFAIPRETIHEGTNKSAETAILYAVFVADKGKSLMTQVQ